MFKKQSNFIVLLLNICLYLSEVTITPTSGTDVEITKPTTEMTAKEVTQDDMVTAYCEATGNPAPKISWIDKDTTKDVSENSAATNQVNTIKDGTTVKSTIQIQAKGFSTIVCNASNNASTAEIAAIKITTRAKKQTFVNPGGKATMNCSALVQDATDVISWYHSKTLLKHGGQVEIAETSTPKSSKLTIKEIKKSDAGDYICKVKKSYDAFESYYYHLHVNASAAISTSLILQLSIMILFSLMM